MLAPFVPLWSHQEVLLSQLEEAWKTNRRVLVQCPTGGGKTRIMTWLAHRIYKQGLRLIIGVHLDELIDQVSEALTRFGIPHGIMARGKADPIENIYIASVQTMVRRLDRIEAPDFYFRDEAHHSTASTDSAVFEKFKRAMGAGFTATPRRRDGTGLDNIYNTYVLGPQISELIEVGHLVRPRLCAPESNLDLTGVHQEGGDYNQNELRQAYEKTTITGDAVEHYIRLCPDEQAISFYVSVAEAEKAAKLFHAAGVHARAIHGNLNKFDRRNMIDSYRHGDIKILTNCNLLLEGFDVPGINAVIWCKPTKSVTAWMQGNGRAMRADPERGKTDCLIIDHVRNWETWGLWHPAMDREWDISGRKKREGETAPPLARCAECHYVGPPFTICPDCLAVREVKERNYKQVDGQLTFIDDEKALAHIEKKKAQREREAEIFAANSNSKLDSLAEKRGWSPEYLKVQKNLLSARIARSRKTGGERKRWG